MSGHIRCVPWLWPPYLFYLGPFGSLLLSFNCVFLNCIFYELLHQIFSLVCTRWLGSFLFLLSLLLSKLLFEFSKCLIEIRWGHACFIHFWHAYHTVEHAGFSRLKIRSKGLTELSLCCLCPYFEFIGRLLHLILHLSLTWHGITLE